MFKHILVPTDGSDPSQEAVRRAVRFAKAAGAHITAFYSRESKSGKLAEEQASEILGFVENLCCGADISCKKLSWASDSPHEAILKAAEQFGCDLILMASNGHKGFKKLLLGSVTQEVLTHSTIPVLVYRSSQGQDELSA